MLRKAVKLPVTLLTNVKLRRLNIALQDALLAERERHKTLQAQHQTLLQHYTAACHHSADLQAHLDSINASMYGAGRG